MEQNPNEHELVVGRVLLQCTPGDFSPHRWVATTDCSCCVQHTQRKAAPRGKLDSDAKAKPEHEISNQIEYKGRTISSIYMSGHLFCLFRPPFLILCREQTSSLTNSFLHRKFQISSEGFVHVFSSSFNSFRSFSHSMRKMSRCWHGLVDGHWKMFGLSKQSRTGKREKSQSPQHHSCVLPDWACPWPVRRTQSRWTMSWLARYPWSSAMIPPHFSDTIPMFSLPTWNFGLVILGAHEPRPPWRFYGYFKNILFDWYFWPSLSGPLPNGWGILTILVYMHAYLYIHTECVWCVCQWYR